MRDLSWLPSARRSRRYEVLRGLQAAREARRDSERTFPAIEKGESEVAERSPPHRPQYRIMARRKVGNPQSTDAAFPSFPGETHPCNKLLIEDVALLRLAAADRALPKGLMEAFARARRCSRASIAYAVGGRTWSGMTDPPPVDARRRVTPSTTRKAPSCPRCDRRKCARGCSHRFHSIDHRCSGRSRRPERVA